MDSSGRTCELVSFLPPAGLVPVEADVVEE